MYSVTKKSKACQNDENKMCERFQNVWKNVYPCLVVSEDYYNFVVAHVTSLN